jgi:hypothetical protein
MHASNFDELTKALANSPSRRHALKVIVTTSIGGLFGLTSIGTAFGRHRADTNVPSGPTGNSNCAKFCAAVFGANTSAAGQCTSDGAHGKGLCRQCPNTTPQNICCKRLGSGYCSGSAPVSCACDIAHCCADTCNQCCSNSQCSNGNTCGASHTCVCGGMAACIGTNTCVAGSCCPNDNVCGNTCCSSGQTCLNNESCCDTGSVCGSSCGCPEFYSCISQSCVCTNPCGSQCCHPVLEICQNGSCHFEP